MVASLGTEQAEYVWEAPFTMVSALGISPHRFWVGSNMSPSLRDHCLIRIQYPAPSGGAEYINMYTETSETWKFSIGNLVVSDETLLFLIDRKMSSLKSILHIHLQFRF